MMSILKAAIPIFGGPKNYAEMLLKLAGFTFWLCFILLYILRRNEEANSLIITYFPDIIPPEFIPENINISQIQVFIISLLVAFIFHFLQLHNVIQKPFRIRAIFDTNYIFKPLAARLGISFDDAMKQAFLSKRGEVMQEIFYDFASSTKEKTVVDKHNIHQALWLWSLFWACEEAIFLLILFSIAFGYFGEWGTVKIFAVLVAILLLAMWQIWSRVAGNAKAQVHQIANNAEAAAAATRAINAL